MYQFFFSTCLILSNTFYYFRLIKWSGFVIGVVRLRGKDFSRVFKYIFISIFTANGCYA